MLNSLQILNQCLRNPLHQFEGLANAAVLNYSEDHPSEEDRLGEEDGPGEEGRLSKEGHPSAEHGEVDYLSEEGHPSVEHGEVDYLSEEGRPVTPLVASEHEPCHSMSGRVSGYLQTPTTGWGLVGMVGKKSEMDLLNESAVDSKHQLVHAEDKYVFNVVILTWESHNCHVTFCCSFCFFVCLQTLSCTRGDEMLRNQNQVWIHHTHILHHITLIPSKQTHPMCITHLNLHRCTRHVCNAHILPCIQDEGAADPRVGKEQPCGEEAEPSLCQEDPSFRKGKKEAYCHSQMLDKLYAS